MIRAIIFFTIAFCYQYSSAQQALLAIDTTMILVKGGTFQMGSNTGKADERPVHTVKIKDLLIGKYEVTQAQWKLVMDSNKGNCLNRPVYDLSWNAIQTFIDKLNKLTGKHYRLPTEAEWEYAATGGQQSKAYKYSGSDNLDEVAWYEPNAEKKTHQVGLKKPNELGLYDMSGNVWELCSDKYSKNFYSVSAKQDPVNTSGSIHVSRGGSWRSPEQRCQSRARNKDIRDHHIGNGGFRLVQDL